MMDYVIGSGAAAMACAEALLQKGREVTVIDAGLDLEPEAQARLAALRAKPQAGWTAQDVAFLKERMTASPRGIPQKRLYGSDYPYRSIDPEGAPVQRCVHIAPSYARGGFSSVWGASILPYEHDELAGWPIPVAEMEAAYRAVMRLMPCAAAEDELAGHYPLYADAAEAPPKPLDLSRQAAAILAGLRRNGDRVRGLGVRFGQARLAIRERDCQYCGLCLYGCPHQVVYSAADTLERLIREPRLTYLPGVLARAFEERAEGVVIRGRDLSSGEEVSYQGERLFIGAGVVSSAKIVLESLGLYDREFEIQDSSYFLMPALALQSTPGAEAEALQTLSQLFLEVAREDLGGKKIHLALYTYNDIFRQLFRGLLLGGRGPLGGAVRALCDRFVMLGGFLHSDVSTAVRVRLGADHVLRLRRGEDKGERRLIRRLGWLILKNARLFCLAPVVPMISVSDPGRSYHSGAVFPMSAAPQGHQSDRYGRPFGLKRVHVVDSAVLPKVAAGPITLTAMANAHRIGAAPEYD